MARPELTALKRQAGTAVNVANSHIACSTRCKTVLGADTHWSNGVTINRFGKTGKDTLTMEYAVVDADLRIFQIRILDTSPCKVYVSFVVPQEKFNDALLMSRACVEFGTHKPGFVGRIIEIYEQNPGKEIQCRKVACKTP